MGLITSTRELGIGTGHPNCNGFVLYLSAPLVVPALIGLQQLCHEPEEHIGSELEPCSFDPLTGWFIDGYCRQDDRDHGSHTVCAEVTQGFLEYTKGQGNDLSTPRGGFPGLKPGDMWCLCAARWRQAMLAGSAPRVVAAATHQASLQVNSVEEMTRQDDSCPGSA